MKKIINNILIVFAFFCIGYFGGKAYENLNISNFFESKQKTEVVKKEEVNKSTSDLNISKKEKEKENSENNKDLVKNENKETESSCGEIQMKKGVLYFLNTDYMSDKFVQFLRFENKINVESFKNRCFTLKTESEEEKINLDYQQVKVYSLKDGVIKEKRVSEIVEKYNIKFETIINYLHKNCVENEDYCQFYEYVSEKDYKKDPLYLYTNNNEYLDITYDYDYNYGQSVLDYKFKLKDIVKNTDSIKLDQDGCLNFLGIKDEQDRKNSKRCNVLDSEIVGLWGRYFITQDEWREYYDITEILDYNKNHATSIYSDYLDGVYPLFDDYYNQSSVRYVVFSSSGGHGNYNAWLDLYDIHTDKIYPVFNLSKYEIKDIRKSYGNRFIVHLKYNSINEIKVGDYSFKGDELTTSDKYILVDLDKCDFDLHIEKPFGKVDVFKNGNISINRGDDSLDYIIPAYIKADKKSEKMLLLTNKEELLENNPLKFKYGSFKYPKEVLDINLVFDKLENNFVKMKLYIGDVFKNDIYFEKKFFNFLNY